MKTIKTFLTLVVASLALSSCDRLSNAVVETGAGMMPATSSSSMVPTSTPSTTTPTTAPTAVPTAAPTFTDADYVQVERLARPAINEGLLVTTTLLNTWNSVPPTADLTPAAAPIAAEATTVLKALGNTDADVNGLFKALLPDVMRIDTTKGSGYAGSAPGKLDNLTKDLRPVGGRMITDDVMDVTLAVIVPGGAPTGPAVAGLESDNVSYDGPNANGSKHKPVLSEFPYLPAPN